MLCVATVGCVLCVHVVDMLRCCVMCWSCDGEVHARQVRLEVTLSVLYSGGIGLNLDKDSGYYD
jgi:hypothetical protein